MIASVISIAIAAVVFLLGGQVNAPSAVVSALAANRCPADGFRFNSHAYAATRRNSLPLPSLMHRDRRHFGNIHRHIQYKRLVLGRRHVSSLQA